MQPPHPLIRKSNSIDSNHYRAAILQTHSDGSFA
jgi:hypothetical protein